MTSAQLLLATQALAKLKQLGGPIGQAVTSIGLPRLADFNAAPLGTLSRALVEGLGVQAEPLLRAVSTARLEEVTIEGSRTRAQRTPTHARPHTHAPFFYLTRPPLLTHYILLTTINSK